MSEKQLDCFLCVNFPLLGQYVETFVHVTYLCDNLMEYKERT